MLSAAPFSSLVELFLAKFFRINHQSTSPMNKLCSLINYVALPLSHEDLLGEDVDGIVAKYNRVHFAGAQQECNSNSSFDTCTR